MGSNACLKVPQEDMLDETEMDSLRDSGSCPPSTYNNVTTVLPLALPFSPWPQELVQPGIISVRASPGVATELSPQAHLHWMPLGLHSCSSLCHAVVSLFQNAGSGQRSQAYVVVVGGNAHWPR